VRRGWLAARGTSLGDAATTLAATVAAAWNARPAQAQAAGQVWLATPVHYFAGLDTVQYELFPDVSLGDAPLNPGDTGGSGVTTPVVPAGAPAAAPAKP